MPRFYCPAPLATDGVLDLPAGAARHVQVLRLQPGDTITLFHDGGEFDATVTHMGRSDVRVQVGAHHPVEREALRAVHLLVGMPANDRMDWLVEKATELGVASIQPLMTERSVLRLSGERAEKKVAHWHSVAVAACEQCGGNRVPVVHPVMGLAQWLTSNPQAVAPSLDGKANAALPARMLLSLRATSQPLRTLLPAAASSIRQPVTFLSGPEGGLSAAEEDAALACGFVPVSLGQRVLRAETAALAALTLLAE
ncbi:MAG: 16S rRNA (uracil(1498)-N(3))-methyltransferase [Rhodoferax sp.]